MSLIKFDYIRYKNDKKCAITTDDNMFVKKIVHNDIEYFMLKPKSASDFSRTSWYFIKKRICDAICQKLHCHYTYLKVNILLLGESEDDLEKKIQAKRLTYPVMYTSPSVDTDGENRKKKNSQDQIRTNEKREL